MTGPELLESLLAAACNLPTEQLPRFVGRLAEANAVAQARLLAPTPASGPDELLDVEQAAARLNLSESYLYRHHFPTFERRVGRRRLYSAAGIATFINNYNRK
jgi:hypothetical protein